MFGYTTEMMVVIFRMPQYHNDLKIVSLCSVLISFGCVCRFYFSHFGAVQQQWICREVFLAVSAWQTFIIVLHGSSFLLLQSLCSWFDLKSFLLQAQC
jgi:hypothetical protein